jgi:hypothetical protein
MPDHVIDNPYFHVRAPAPPEKIMEEAKKSEDKAEEDAKPKEDVEKIEKKVEDKKDAEAEVAAKDAPSFI